MMQNWKLVRRAWIRDLVDSIRFDDQVMPVEDFRLDTFTHKNRADLIYM